MRERKKGIFITIEGIEGCGKSTQVRILKNYLEKKGLDVLLTREPGGTEIGNQIRKVLLDKRNKKIVPCSELFLYAASRVQHVEEVILPALQEGKAVVCDRFSDATTAYQRYGRGLNRNMVSVINSFSTKGLIPDLTIILDLPQEIGLKRARARNREKGLSMKEGRFEEESLLFHKKVRQGYLRIKKSDPKRVKVINAGHDIKKVNSQISKEVDKLLQKGITHGY